jgi:DNA repair protein RadA/Sms
VYACQRCGHQSAKWLGRCPDCGGWGSLVEEVQLRGRAAARAAKTSAPEVPRRLSEVEVDVAARRQTGIGELDRVLGGGLVRGSVILVGGDPGIGKSTLALQAAFTLAAAPAGVKVLYVAGEESPEQVKVRGARVGLGEPGGADSSPWVVAETSLESLLAVMERFAPEVMVVDSVQTLASSELGSAPGSVGQIREVAARLVTACKAASTAAFLIGHVTKEGFLAGPRVLEHMVDTVLYFEGDRSHAYRILRAVKNRFGSTNEIGVFEMQAAGLVGVPNASEIFLAERPASAPGSAVVATMEGSRPILVEIQGLVTPATFGTPRRTTLGLDPNRAALLAAVLEKKMGLRLVERDLFLNVVGGVRVDEPAVDLGVVAAIASSYLDRPLPADLLVVGEVGLTGEVRAVGRVEARLREGASLGFRRAVVPAGSARQLPPIDGVEVIGARTLEDLWAAAFGGAGRA